MTKIGKFIGSLIYTALYFSPVVGDMIWILDARKKRNSTVPVTLGDVISMLLRYTLFASLLYWILR